MNRSHGVCQAMLVTFALSLGGIGHANESGGAVKRNNTDQYWISFRHYSDTRCQAEFKQGHVIATACGIPIRRNVFYRLGRWASPGSTDGLAKGESREGIIIHSILVDSYTALIQTVMTADRMPSDMISTPPIDLVPVPVAAATTPRPPHAVD